MEVNALGKNGMDQWVAPTWLTGHELDAVHCLYAGQLPAALLPSRDELRAWWDLHPAEFPELLMHGRVVRAPRWQQAYGKSYRFSGRVNQALPIPTLLEPLRAWAQQEVDARMNGLLLNWYDGGLGHYIGRHRDKTGDLVVGAPIVTVSLGADRIFRVRAWRGAGVRDIPVSHGTVLVMTHATNAAFTHEVPHRARDRGRRISVTIRAFKQSPASARSRASAHAVA